MPQWWLLRPGARQRSGTGRRCGCGRAFLRERCERKPGAFEPTSALYIAYEKWCGQSGERAVSKAAFGVALSERGYATGRGPRGERGRVGLKLLPEEVPWSDLVRIAEEGGEATS